MTKVSNKKYNLYHKSGEYYKIKEIGIYYVFKESIQDKAKKVYWYV